jgi:hypothetical protein
VDRPFARRLNVPDEALARTRLGDFLSQEVFDRVPVLGESNEG